MRGRKNSRGGMVRAALRGHDASRLGTSVVPQAATSRRSARWEELTAASGCVERGVFDRHSPARRAQRTRQYPGELDRHRASSGYSRRARAVPSCGLSSPGLRRRSDGIGRGAELCPSTESAQLDRRAPVRGRGDMGEPRSEVGSHFGASPGP